MNYKHFVFIAISIIPILGVMMFYVYISLLISNLFGNHKIQGNYKFHLLFWLAMTWQYFLFEKTGLIYQ